MPPRVHRIATAELTLVAYEWHPERRGAAPTILLAHATGFHARCWVRVVDRLGARHVVAVDQRGHGGSDKVLPTSWRDFGRDLLQIVRALELSDILGVGHSMGGYAVTDAAAAAPQSFRRLILIDPVIASLADYHERNAWNPPADVAHPTAKRRNHWASAREMFERFRHRVPFSSWNPDVLRDYCEHGLLPDPNGNGYILACPPDFEAHIYMTSRSGAGIHDSVRAVQVPVLVVRALGPQAPRDWMDFRASPTWPGLARAFPNGRDLYLPDRTHFIPMEDPELVARLICESDG